MNICFLLMSLTLLCEWVGTQKPMLCWALDESYPVEVRQFTEDLPIYSYLILPHEY